MFYKNRNYTAAIEKVKIEFGTLIGCEKDEEAYVVLKELPTMEMAKLTRAQEESIESLMEFFRKAMPGIIVEHNLMENEEKKMTNRDVVDLIYEKFSLTQVIIEKYSNAAFFTRLNKKADSSGASAETSSRAE